MKLFIAEKPSLGRAIAEALPKPHSKGDGFIRVGNGDCVSWCIGHLLEQAEPDAYDPAFKKWRLEQLPIIPREWRLQPRAQTKKQLAVLGKLVKEADQLVHAGDPDREGQLLVDQVIAYLGVEAGARSKVQRCLINDLNPEAVKRALNRLRQNRDFVPLSTSALARSRADWLYGINMTRAYTLQGQKVGYQGVLSVGRVQTPLLGLVVRRDEEIENFVSKPYFEVLAQVQTPSGQLFKAKWQPSEACRPYMDEEGRVLLKALAVNVVSRITNKPARVNKIEKKEKTRSPPLPYNLSALQIDAARRYGMNAKQVLDLCQGLYERHKLITYPRSDSRHLPEEHFGRGPAVAAAIGANSKALGSAVAGADTSLKSKAWNDGKVDAHHAIIPTEKKVGGSGLNPQELRIYELIGRQYLCQFYPKYAYADTRVELLIEGGVFVAAARQTRNPGWKVLFSKEARPHGDDTEVELPPLKEGELLHCVKGELLDKKTQPPAHFTDATLLSAMTGIARFVKDVEIRKILRETDGLGTEATRAGILELLFKRQFLTRQGRQIRATETGRGLVHSLPEVATTPDMTARWESVLDAISSRTSSYAAFMEPLTASLQGLIARSKSVEPSALKGIKPGKAQDKKFRKKPAARKRAS